MEDPELLEPVVATRRSTGRVASLPPPGPAPESGHAARFVRNVTAISVLVILASAAWRCMPSTIYPLAPVKAATKSIVRAVEDVTAAPEEIPELVQEGTGLTPDLRAPRVPDATVEDAAEKSPAKLGARSLPSEQTADEPPAYEPWNEQRPDVPIAPAASSPARQADEAPSPTP